METLPLELREQIFAHLLSRKDRKEIITLPVSIPSERNDVYNLRMTSRRISAGGSQAFVDIIEDVLTKCEEESLGNLAALVALPGVSNTLTCLSLSTRKTFFARDITTVRDDSRKSWLQANLYNRLVVIMRQMPRLRHLVCLIDAFRPMEAPSLATGPSGTRDEVINMVAGPDPLLVSAFFIP